jgi:hypothetical protein
VGAGEGGWGETDIVGGFVGSLGAVGHYDKFFSLF